MTAVPAHQAWQVRGLYVTHLELVVCEELSAGVLLEKLVGSKAMTQRVFARGQLTRGRDVLQRGSVLLPGDVLTLAFTRGGEEPASRLSGKPLEVVYQDPILLAIDKPAGLLVHGDGTGSVTLTDCVRAMLAKEGRSCLPQAIQRLDVETTGLVLFSLVPELQPRLDAQVAGYDMHKRYLAVIAGRLKASEDRWLELRGPIARDRHDARKMRVAAKGKPSLTRVQTLAYQKGRSLLLVELGSGRKHQIRVHLAHAGHPLLGDALYGGAHHKDGLMLHAWKENLVHPATGERLSLRTAWPQRFDSLFPDTGYDPGPRPLTS